MTQSAVHRPAEPRAPERSRVDEAACLLAESAQDPWGELSVSEYETGRLAALAPWLDGHPARVGHLLGQQHPDGTWGPPDGYRLVPTLSAVHALLSCLSTPAHQHRAPVDRLRHAARAGFGALVRANRGTPPDTTAVELVVPALIEGINHLNSASEPIGWRMPLACPKGINGRTLQALRAQVAAGTPVPATVWHAWETLRAPERAGEEVQLAGGALGGSAAATAAWLSAQPATAQHSAEALAYLHQLQRRYRGPVPSVSAITYSERAWLLRTFAAAGMHCTVPATLLGGLENALTAHGAPAADGLPPDADDTAAVLLALATHGRPHRPDALMDFRADDHFRCLLGERTPSVSTNAHVLETLAHHVGRHPEDRARYEAAMDSTAHWLLAAQQPDGSWGDTLHASPYYATLCCVQALTDHALPATAAARRRAAHWVLDSQHPDGGWGLWHSTAEETAYALILLHGARSEDPRASDRWAAVRRARAVLRQGVLPVDTALWYDKDLYAPLRVIRAAVLSALHLTRETAQDHKRSVQLLR